MELRVTKTLNNYLIQVTIVILLSILTPAYSFAQEPKVSWLATLASAINVNEVETLTTHANVTVSDGLTYETYTVFNDPQRAIWHLVYPDRIATSGVEGLYYWSYDGSHVTEGDSFTRDLVLGHQIHAQLLFFDRLHEILPERKRIRFNNTDAYEYQTSDHYSMIVDKRDFPLALINSRYDFKITYTFDDFRNVNGINLPYKVTIDDESRTFVFEFDKIEINQGSMETFLPPSNLLTDEQQLLRLHRIAMDDHFFERTDGIKATQGDSSIMVSNGEVYRLSKEQAGQGIDRIMSSRYHTSYDDLIRPIAKVSEDGTLGWVIARIEAKGMRLDADGNETEPLHFICAWIMLYEKVDGVWKSIGNVSTFP